MRGRPAAARGAAAALAALAALAPAAPRAEGFADPLDVPARAVAHPERAPLVAVAAAGDRVVAVGARGLAITSADGGATWTQGAVPVSTDLTAVQLVTPSLGWAAGHDAVILSTDDGGVTWRRRLDRRGLGALLRERWPGGAGDAPPGLRDQLAILDAPDATCSFLDVWFDDGRTGFAVGSFNLAVRTGDGGVTWEPWLDRVPNPASLHLYALRRAGDAVLLVGEQGLLLRLDPAARRFVGVDSPATGSLFALAAGARAAVAVGLRGVALRSDDAGASWRRVATGVEEGLTGAAALPDGRLVAVTQGGRVLVSDGDGERFRPVAAAGPGAAAVAATPGGALVVAGTAGVRRLPAP